jgi:N6-adenosine-specific RNA methylase IME4
VSLTDLPRRHYKAIYADPPWGFTTFDKRNAIPQRADTPHYAAMTFDDLKALPVADVAAKDCVLHMWVISSHIERALQLAEAWGFAFKSLGMVWVKTQKGAPETPKMGMGLWFRQEVEVCLLFTKGKPPRADKGVRQVIMEPAREHSRKPDEAADRVMRLSEGPYLELFARTPRDGWDSWGNEVTKFPQRNGSDDLEALLG